MTSRTRRPVDLFRVYQYRIKAIEALLSVIEGKPEIAPFETAISLLDSAAINLGDRRDQARYGDFAVLLRAFLFLVRWGDAVRHAELDGDRYLRAARQAAKDLLEKRETTADGGDDILNAARRLSGPIDLEQVTELAQLLLTIPLPIPVFSAPQGIYVGEFEKPGEPTEKHAVTVAFLSFDLYEGAFGNPQMIEPQTIHDLTVEVRVPHWPEGAQTLELDVATVEPADTFELPKFSFLKPAGPEPYSLKSTGRMIVKTPQSFLSRPLEFSYRARFEPIVEELKVRVEGQRRLRVQTYDFTRQPLTGYSQLDPVIMKIRDQARSTPGIRDAELDDFLRILIALANTAGQALQGDLFKGINTESEFQRLLRTLLRQRPDIGAQLEEHPHAGAGIIDLSFRGIPLELKVLDKPADAKDIECFLPQTAAYISAADRRFGLLVALDSSIKTQAPGSAADDIFLREVSTPSGQGLSLLVGSVIIRGNLPKPSAL